MDAAALHLNEGVGYDKLTPETLFFIMEGNGAVGEGVAREIWHAGHENRLEESL